jgi:hypothetical protein
MISTLAWFAQQLAQSTAISVSTTASTKAGSYLIGMPTNAKELETYDKATIVQAVSELSSLDQELSFAINLAFTARNKELLSSLHRSRQALARLRDSVEFSQHFEIKKNTDPKGLAYIDSLLLTKCFAISEAAKDTFTAGSEYNSEDVVGFLKKLNEEFRNIDRVAHVRSLAVELPLNQLLRILETDNPDLYNAVKSVALFALAVDSEKKMPLRHGQYYKKIAVRTLLTVRTLEGQKGPYIGMKEFFSEYRNLNPDLTNMQFEDVEKSLDLLQKDGWISGVEREPDGNKIVIFRLDDRKALEIVDKDPSLQNGGVTAEELALRSGWSVDYSRRVLSNMEKAETARRVLRDDATTRWYFPSRFSGSQKSEAEAAKA